MKFRCEEDRQSFRLELGLPINELEQEKDHKTFFNKRSKVVSLLKDFRKSQAAGREWDLHRHKFMWAIKKFHHSPEGRKFHRKLDRFNMTHLPNPKEGLFLTREDAQFLKKVEDFLKDEMGFYNSLVEQAELELLFDYISGLRAKQH